MQANVPLPLDEPRQLVKRTRRPLARTRSRAHGDSKRLKGYRTTACSSPTRVPKADLATARQPESPTRRSSTGQDCTYRPFVDSLDDHAGHDRVSFVSRRLEARRLCRVRHGDGQSMNIVTDERRGTTDKYVATNSDRYPTACPNSDTNGRGLRWTWCMVWTPSRQIPSAKVKGGIQRTPPFALLICRLKVRFLPAHHSPFRSEWFRPDVISHAERPSAAPNGSRRSRDRHGSVDRMDPTMNRSSRAFSLS